MSGDVPAVSVKDLRYQFAHGLGSALDGCTLNLKRGSRTLLIGANGAGKSTLLRLMAGKRLCDTDIQVFGMDVFRSRPRGVTYLGTEWAMNPVVRGDISVEDFLNSLGGFRFKERRDRLLDLLDIDLSWHMHAISDGERRRVQLCMGLMEPWDLLLLDEVTVDLDVQVRCDLLDFLKEESNVRNATIIYATHIFDGIHDFPTDIIHIQLGRTTTDTSLPWPLKVYAGMPETILQALPQNLVAESKAGTAHEVSLLKLALGWLREDRALREKKERKQGIKRGAKRDQETTDARKFFSQYDYHAHYA
ncbi:CCR4-NOT regulatory complex component [Malassezia vespertilionis]|uniref:CCR4-NOT regulatory complex component n=1 Tax=Malassezia vespertilionis TaxID=2020962 RepID=UPI0024B0C0D5|nr:CCR4-NOT regulatory complex component [Malassezia vespertilionis]WFD05194.1 CCR4-NOT regulatory complex component [Malassezia vespertilionis]